MEKIMCSAKIRFRGIDKTAYFGRGVAQLLYGIKKYHSLNMATKSLGMAYSKAWRIIRDAEDSLGVELLERHGNSGASLSHSGNRILEIYEEAEISAEQAAKEVLRRYFGEIYHETIVGRDGMM